MGLTLVLGVVVVGPGGVADAEPASAQEEGGTTALASDLFKNLAEGAAGQVGGSLAGWALGALGIGGSDDDAGLDAIQGELEAIEQTLGTIETTLTEIATEIAVQTCDQALEQTTAAVSAIKTAYTMYLGFVSDGQETPPVVDDESMVSWSNDVLTTGGGVITPAIPDAISTIETAMIGAGGSGILSTCLDPEVLAPPAAGAVGDGGYYGFDADNTKGRSVASYVNYFYLYQALGVMMVQEAYHFQAQQIAYGANGGLPVPQLTPQQVGQLCLNDALYPATVSTLCNEAAAFTNTVYESLSTQFELGGLPYTDDKVVLVNNGGTDPLLFVRSLEDFTSVAGDKCATPLVSADPCGVTTADHTTVGQAMDVVYDGYTPWTTPGNAQMTNAISLRASGQTPGQYMNQQGFADAEHKIILLSDTVAYSVQQIDGDSLHGTLGCFVHTDMTQGVMCDSHEPQNVLLQHGNEPCENSNDVQWFGSKDLPLQNQNNQFFEAWTNCNQIGFAYTTLPGWDTANTSSSAVQYRWPTIDVSTLTCTDGRSPTNAGGVPTMCGADFVAMFDTLVTRPATCGGTTFGQCTSDGYWILESDGDVHSFGEVEPLGGVKDDLLPGESAIAITSRPGGLTFWVLTDQGRILGRGANIAMAGIQPHGPVVAQVDLAQLTEPDERLSTLSATPDGRGLWVFTTAGRILSFGGAAAAELLTGADQVLALDLDGPIVHSFAAPDGHGVYMIAADGGVFATGSARFVDSVRGVLTDLHGPPGLPAQPIVGAVADPDGFGYWLVGADGGVFSFAADFHGSLPAMVPFHELVAPVNGMAPYGAGYVLIAGDGGLFNFSNIPFAGSAHGRTDSPVVGVATGT